MNFFIKQLAFAGKYLSLRFKLDKFAAHIPESSEKNFTMCSAFTKIPIKKKKKKMFENGFNNRTIYSTLYPPGFASQI